MQWLSKLFKVWSKWQFWENEKKNACVLHLPYAIKFGRPLWIYVKIVHAEEYTFTFSKTMKIGDNKINYLDDPSWYFFKKKKKSVAGLGFCNPTQFFWLCVVYASTAIYGLHLALTTHMHRWRLDDNNNYCFCVRKILCLSTGSAKQVFMQNVTSCRLLLAYTLQIRRC